MRLRLRYQDLLFIPLIVVLSACGAGVIDYVDTSSDSAVTAGAQDTSKFISIKGQISTGEESVSPASSSLSKLMAVKKWEATDGADADETASTNLFTVQATLFQSGKSVGGNVVADANGVFEIKVDPADLGEDSTTTQLVLHATKGAQSLVSFVEADATQGSANTANIDTSTTTAALLVVQSMTGEMGVVGSAIDPITLLTSGAIGVVTTALKYDATTMVQTNMQLLQGTGDDGMGRQTKFMAEVVKQSIQVGAKLSTAMSIFSGNVAGNQTQDILARAAAGQGVETAVMQSTAQGFAASFSQVSTFVKENVAKVGSTINDDRKKNGSDALLPVIRCVATATDATVFKTGGTMGRFISELYANGGSAGAQKVVGDLNHAKGALDFIKSIDDKGAGATINMQAAFGVIRDDPTKLAIKDSATRQSGMLDLVNVVQAATSSLGTTGVLSETALKSVIQSASATMTVLSTARTDGTLTSTGTLTLDYAKLVNTVSTTIAAGNTTTTTTNTTTNISYNIQITNFYTAPTTTTTTTTTIAPTTTTATYTPPPTTTTYIATTTTTTYTAPMPAPTPPAALTITSMTPTSGTTSFIPSGVVQAVFSKDLSSSTVTTTNFKCTYPGNIVAAGVVAYDAALRRVQFTPTGGWGRASMPTCTASTAIKASDGAALASPVSTTFTVFSDFAIASTSPTNNSTSAPLLCAFTVTFNNPVDSSTCTTSNLSATTGGSNVAGTVAAGGNGKSCTFTPSATCTPLASYTYTVSNGFKDTGNMALSAQTTYAATVTSDATPPAVPVITVASPSGANCNMTINAETDDVSAASDIVVYCFAASSSGTQVYDYVTKDGSCSAGCPTYWPTQIWPNATVNYNFWQGYSQTKYWTCRARDAAHNWSSNSNEVSCATSYGPPSYSLSASTTKSAAADITITPMPGATGYKIYRSTDSSFTPGSGNLVTTLSGNAPSAYTDAMGSGMVGTTVYYKLISQGGAGDSAPTSYTSFPPAVVYSKNGVPGSSGRATYPSMVLDSNGKAHMSSVNNGSGDLMYATNKSGSWVQGTVYSTSTAEVGVNAITRDSSNNIYISFFDNEWGNKSTWPIDTQDYLRVAKCTSSSDCTITGNWVVTTIRKMTASSAYQGRGLNAIAVDSSGKLHVIFVESDKKLYETVCSSSCNTSSNWASQGGTTISDSNSSGATLIEALGTQGAVSRLSLILDSSGKPQVVYVSAGYSNPNYTYDVRYAKYTTSWQTPQSIQSQIGGSLLYPSLALDSSGNAHVSFAYYNSSNYALRYATNAGGGGSPPSFAVSTIETSNSYCFNYGGYSSIAVDTSNNKIHIAHGNDYGSEVRYAVKPSGGSWTTSSIDTYNQCGGSNSNWYVNIALDSSGNPVFGYFLYSVENVGSYGLKYTTMLPY